MRKGGRGAHEDRHGGVSRLGGLSAGDRGAGADTEATVPPTVGSSSYRWGAENVSFQVGLVEFIPQRERRGPGDAAGRTEVARETV